ncbi:MAG: glycoside hydrolase family 16 protein [Williamsia sp.]|nr:glycoside hydrolase family 16 protein [Williamsia sp.]
MKWSKPGSRYAIAAIAVLTVFAQCTAVRKSATDTNSFRIVFFDDFSGSTLDRSKWNPVITGQVVNNEQQAYVDSSATIYLVSQKEVAGARNGALVIQPRFSPGFATKEGKKFDFISGRIDTRSKVEFRYGTVSARIKLSEGVGFWPAWWMLGVGRWPETGEIDIMEFIGQKEWTNAAVHGPGYSGNTPFVKRDSFAVKDPVTNWHIYSVDWEPTSLVFKVDEKEFYRVTRPMAEQYGKWSFDNAKFLILNFALGGGYPGGVNKVKEPYFGLPASSVELIKQGKCKMWVDWVRVTQP